ncbi:MAG: putative inner rane protein [Ramlibacter sp.]|nr:putative inner rane protein [Ramlibacter sp.]
MSATSFQVVPVQGLTFSGPSAEWLMRVLAQPGGPVGFDFGLMPGVFAGSFLGAWLGGELKLEGFKDGYGMRRYIAGAILMGFGAMLAGGCAVGAGVTGGAVFALTAWLTLASMWAGAGITDWALDRKQATPASARQPRQHETAMAP